MRARESHKERGGSDGCDENVPITADLPSVPLFVSADHSGFHQHAHYYTIWTTQFIPETNLISPSETDVEKKEHVACYYCGFQINWRGGFFHYFFDHSYYFCTRPIQRPAHQGCDGNTQLLQRCNRIELCSRLMLSFFKDSKIKFL